MKLGFKIITATFIDRPNRFTIIARHGSRRLKCYFPNPGRMKELLRPNTKLAIQASMSSKSARTTAYDTVAVRSGRRWVSIDSRVPNKLVEEALESGRLREFQSYTEVKEEFTYNRSRFDFLLESEDSSCLLEVKSCTLVVEGVGIFPDAPTARGSKHLLDLVKAKKSGYRACMLFVIQRDDATSFSPNQKTDPRFCSTLNWAIGKGVEVYAKRCKFSRFDLTLDANVPVNFGYLVGNEVNVLNGKA